MVDTQDVDGLDPYDLMESETARLDGFFAALDDAGFARPSRAEGWSVRDMLAHFTSSEEYNRACLDGTVNDFLASLGAKGATDLATANEIGIRELDAVATPDLLDQWRERARRTSATCARATAATSTPRSVPIRPAGRRSTSPSSSRSMPAMSAFRSPRPTRPNGTVWLATGRPVPAQGGQARREDRSRHRDDPGPGSGCRRRTARCGVRTGDGRPAARARRPRSATTCW